MPATGVESWTVLDDGLVVVAPVERFLAHLSAIERSPNTVRAYAHSLALWFEWLGVRGRAWDAAGVEDVSEFVRWLRAPADNVIVLDISASQRSEATVNRHLAAVFAFYDFYARAGVELADSLVAWRRVPRGSYKPFLHHVTAGRPIPTRPVKLRTPRRLPGSLTVAEVTTILAACTRLRDRFLIALLAETGMRIGQALGLRHTDFVSRRREVAIVPRDDNANGARAKTRATTTVPVSTPLVRLHVARAGSQRVDAFDLHRLSLQPRLGVAYSIQCRHDDRTVRLIPEMIRQFIDLLATTGVGSLLDRPVDDWVSDAVATGRAGSGSRTVGQLRYAYRRLLDLVGGVDAESEFARDTWRAPVLSIPTVKGCGQIHFGNVAQPWLRAPVKRYARLRLASGKAFASVDIDVRAVRWCSRFLTEQHPEVGGPGQLTRPVIEHYLSWLAA